MHEARAASLQPVTANDVLISAAYKVNPISDCHILGEQENKAERETVLCERESKCHSLEYKAGLHTVSGYLDVISRLCSVVYWGFH